MQHRHRRVMRATLQSVGVVVVAEVGAVGGVVGGDGVAAAAVAEEPPPGWPPWKVGVPGADEGCVGDEESVEVGDVLRSGK